MTTIINTPPAGESADSGLSLIFGIIIALILVALFFVYGLPAIRSNGVAPKANDVNVNVKLPPATTAPVPAVNP
jgi:hypothetical protein